MCSASARITATLDCHCAAAGSGRTALNSFRATRGGGHELGPDVGVGDQGLGGGVSQGDELEAARLPQLVEVDVVALAQLGDRLDGCSERDDEFGLGLDRGVDVGVGGAVDRERLLEVPEHADVVDDQPVVLVGEHPVGAGDRLHQGVVAHRPVEVDRRARSGRRSRSSTWRTRTRAGTGRRGP